MSDLIDRQAAIDAISKKQDTVFDRDEEIDTTALYVYSECKAIIKDLPSAQPKERCIANITLNEEDLERIVNEQVDEIKDSLPRKGKWIDYSDEGYGRLEEKMRGDSE